MSPVLLGGRKPVKAKIVRGKCIGRGGLEGEIFATTVIIKKGGRTRAVQLAEKQFLKGSPKGGLRNPSKQFKIMTELKRLNSEKKLGLHILPTIRLRRIKGKKPTLILTHYKEVVDLFSLSRRQYERICAQGTQETKVLKEQGYFIHLDAWHLIKDPFTGKPTFYLTDFGNITKIRKRK